MLEVVKLISLPVVRTSLLNHLIDELAGDVRGFG